MKKMMILMVCALLGGATMQSCKKDKKKTTSSSSSGNSNEFSLTVDGVDFDPSTITVQEAGGVIVCEGTNGTDNSFSLSIDELIEPGVYDIDGNTQFDVYHSDDNNATFYASTAGTVTIIANDTASNTISGTFNCTLERFLPAGTKTVTDGTFNLHYQQ